MEISSPLNTFVFLQYEGSKASMLECSGLCRDSVLKNIIKFIKPQGKYRMFFQLQLYLISTYLN